MVGATVAVCTAWAVGVSRLVANTSIDGVTVALVLVAAAGTACRNGCGWYGGWVGSGR